ncbi:MAG: caspase family protein [Acidobacteria bacterium]|nr:caspase family protein [Acidobacteriota bacterium]
MRKVLVVFLLTVCAAALAAPPGPSAAPAFVLEETERRKPFALELPEIGTQTITAPEAVIPHINLNKLRLRVYKPYADSIRYGKIYTKINGESANTIFNFNSASDGYVITGNLESKPRFRLQPGKNVVEINAKANDGREYYASFVLLTKDRQSGDPTNDSDATIETVPVTSGGDRQPPTLYLIHPIGGIRLSGGTGTVKVTGVAMDDSGAVASVSVNQQEAKLAPATGMRGLSVTPVEAQGKVSAESLKKAVEFEQTINVKEEMGSVAVEAKDSAGNLTRLSIPVKRREAAVSSTFKGRKLALVVGVSKYKYHERGLSDLAYADVDARSVRDFLQQREGGGFAPSDILFLENGAATIEAVRAALNSFLPKAGADDLIFIFIAGHGGPDPYAPQNLYFMLHDTNLADMANTALPMTELQEVLDHKVRAGRLVVFVDTCHSAGLTGEALVTTRGIENNLINLYASKLFNESGRAVMTSSDVNEVSRESPNWGGGHGIFTWALLEGLRGGADANADRLVTAGELFGYVRDRVRMETAFRQNPRALSGLNADLALAVAKKSDVRP